MSDGKNDRVIIFKNGELALGIMKNKRIHARKNDKGDNIFIFKLLHTEGIEELDKFIENNPNFYESVIKRGNVRITRKGLIMSDEAVQMMNFLFNQIKNKKQ